jgi:DNA-binding beta-propeller fold protein YncE
VTLLWLLLAGCRPDPPLAAVAIPDGRPGIGFDDLNYAAEISRVLVPGGRSGHLGLVDPATRMVTTVDGFARGVLWLGGDDEGATSADFGSGFFYVTDRSTWKLHVADKTRQLIGSAGASARPGHARWVAPLGEVWITEPDAQQIEIMSVVDSAQPRGVGAIAVAGLRAALVIDLSRRAAFTLGGDRVEVVDIDERRVRESWPTGCAAPRGLALDAQTGWLFVGCEEGRLMALDARDGSALDDHVTGSGVSGIAYSPTLRHVYVPSADVGALFVFAFADQVGLTPLDTVPAVEGVRCAVADDKQHVYLCDPVNGQILVHEDHP